MSFDTAVMTGCTAAQHYEIVLRGRLGSRLENVLEGFDVTQSDPGSTRLVGWLPDQSALQGALRRVADFGLEVLSVRRLSDL